MGTPEASDTETPAPACQVIDRVHDAKLTILEAVHRAPRPRCETHAALDDAYVAQAGRRADDPEVRRLRRQIRLDEAREIPLDVVQEASRNAWRHLRALGLLNTDTAAQLRQLTA